VLSAAVGGISQWQQCNEVDLTEILATLTATTAKSNLPTITNDKPLVRPVIANPVFPTDQGHECLEENGLYYVCGYLLRKLRKWHNCSDCDILLQELEPATDSTTVYLRQRSLSLLMAYGSGLIAVSQCFADYVKQCQQVFASMFDNVGHEANILTKIVVELLKIPSPVPCPGFPQRKFLHLFVRMLENFIVLCG